MEKKYRLLGTEDMTWICDFCGKKEITTCYTVEDMETGEIRRFGSSCIKKALKITQKEVTELKKDAIERVKDKYKNIIWKIDVLKTEIMNHYRKTRNYQRGFLPKTCICYHKLYNIQNKIEFRMYKTLSKIDPMYKNFVNGI